MTGLAWQLAGRTSMAFHDDHRVDAGEPRGVVAWAEPPEAGDELEDGVLGDAGNHAVAIETA
ncbi:hypothetical protein [Geodermatophilus sp. SYSU D01036]